MSKLACVKARSVYLCGFCLPIQSKVRSTYHSLNLEFKIDERYSILHVEELTSHYLKTILEQSSSRHVTSTVLLVSILSLLLRCCANSCQMLTSLHVPRFLSPTNQRVTDTLIDTVYNDTSAVYSAKDIKRAAHRYYESRRRLGIEEMPDRQVCPVTSQA